METSSFIFERANLRFSNDFWCRLGTYYYTCCALAGDTRVTSPPSTTIITTRLILSPNSTITDRQCGMAACCLKCRLSLNFSILIKRLLSEKLKELGHVYTSNKIYVRLFLKYNSATLEILSERENFQRRTFPSQLSGWSNPVWATATTCLLTQSTAKHYFVSHWPFVISLKHSWAY